MPRLITAMMLLLVLCLYSAVALADHLPPPPLPPPPSLPRPRPRPTVESVEVAHGPTSDGGLMSVGVISALVCLALIGDHRRHRRDDPTLEE